MHIPPTHDPVTLDDLQAIVTAFAGLDGHPRTPADCDTWVTAARAGRWSRAQLGSAALAIMASFTGFRVMPGHVTEVIRSDAERIRARWYCPDPPRHLRDDPAAELVWRRRAGADFRDRALLALAAGTSLDDVPMLRDVEADPPLVVDSGARVADITARIAERRAIPAAVPTTEQAIAETSPARRAALDAVWAAVDACGSCDASGTAPDGSVCRHRSAERA